MKVTGSAGRAEPRDSTGATVPHPVETPTPVAGTLFWAWGVMLLVPVWAPRFFITEDGLAHLYWIEVYRALGAPDHPWNEFFVRQLDWSTPYHLLHFGLQYALAGVLDPHLAQKVVVSVVILSWVGAIHFLSVSINRKLTMGALVSLLLIHSAWMYNGYFAYLGAMPLAVAALGVLSRLERRPAAGSSWKWYVLLAVLGVVAHFAHFFVGALILLLCGLWFIYPWHATPPRRVALGLALLPTAALASWYLLRGTFGAGGMIWEPVYRAAARFVGLAFFRGFAAPSPLFWLALAAFGLTLATLCYTVLGRLRRGEVSERRFVAHLALLLVGLYAVAPVAMGEALNFNGRLQFAMWAWLLPVIPYHLEPRARAIVFIIAQALLLWQVATFTLRSVRLSDQYDAVLAEAAAIPPGSRLESAVQYENTRFEGSFMHVLADTPEDIAMRRGGLLLNSFFPALPYYWIRPRSDSTVRGQFELDLRNDGRGRLSLLIEPLP